MILDHLLEMETRRNESVNRILQSANSVGTELVEFEEWLYKRNAKLGAMTHALRAITQENKSLVQQRENHGRLQQTVQVRPAGIFHVDADRDGDAERGNRGDFGRRRGQSEQSRERTAGRGIVFRGVWKMGKPGAERGIGGNAAHAFSRQFSASPPKRRQGVTTNLRGVQSDALRRISEPRGCVELSNQLAGFGARAKKRKRGNREAFLRHDRFVAKELDPEILKNRGYRGVSADHVRGSVASNNRGIRLVLAGI